MIRFIISERTGEYVPVRPGDRDWDCAFTIEQLQMTKAELVRVLASIDRVLTDLPNSVLLN